MQQRTFLRTLALVGLASAALSLPVLAQDSPADSVAEAARRARAQKNSSAKPATVVTDDTLKAAPATSSPAAAQANTADANASAAGDAGNAAAAPEGEDPAAAPTPEDKAKNDAEIEALKEEIAAKQSEVDLAQRELTLDSDALYAKPDYQGDTAGKEKVAGEQADVSQKKEQLETLKAKLAALTANAPAEPPKPEAPPAQ